MKYLCIAYEEEQKLNDLSKSEWLALRQETLDYVETLRKRGLLIITHALQSATTAWTVRILSGKLSVTDGPFSESKEQLGGFFLIEASYFNEAIEVPANWPSAPTRRTAVRTTHSELRMFCPTGQST